MSNKKEKKCNLHKRDAGYEQAADNLMFTQLALKMDWSMFAAPFANMIAVISVPISS